MRRTVRNRSGARLEPVQKIEVSDRHLGLRLLAVVVFLVIAMASFSYGVMNLIAPSEKGWTEIEANSGRLSCADDLVFLYEMGVRGGVSRERRALTALYTDLTAKAWQLFSNAEGTEGVRSLNDHPGETIEVDPALYRALERVEASGDRWLYLGPVAEIYDNLFDCQEDALTADFDPLLNDDLRDFFARVAAFARDPQAIRVELMGDNRARLNVSEEYLAFAALEEINDLIDFHWMTNAFVIDYLAEALIAQGYTYGTLSSVDGFARVLDGRAGGSYTCQLYDRGTAIGTLRYSGARSLVALRGYPVSGRDRGRYYVRRDGEIRTAYLDMADGLSRVAVADLTAWAEGAGCAEIALRIAPVYIAEALDTDALAALAREGIQSVACEGSALLCTDPGLTLTDLAEGYDVRQLP